MAAAFHQPSAAGRYRAGAGIAREGLIWQTEPLINLSGGSLANRNIPELIEERLLQYPELGERICLGITETAAMGHGIEKPKLL